MWLIWTEKGHLSQRQDTKDSYTMEETFSIEDKPVPVPSKKNKYNDRLNKSLKKNLPKHKFRLLIFAPSGSGKTHLIVRLLKNYYSGFSKVFVINSSWCDPEEPYQMNLGKKITEDHICTDLGDAENFMKDIIDFKTKYPRKPCLVVVDDGQELFAERTGYFSKLLGKIRHHNCSLIVVAQHAGMITAGALNNFNCFILFKRMNKLAMDRMKTALPAGFEDKYKEFSSHPPLKRKNEKGEVVEDETNDYYFLLVDVKGKPRYTLNFDKEI